jgi:hypothetical protein
MIFDLFLRSHAFVFVLVIFVFFASVVLDLELYPVQYLGLWDKVT